MVEVQTRSEETGFKYHKTVREALKYAEKDKTVWKISFTSEGGESIRMLRYADGPNFVIALIGKLTEDEKIQQEWLEKKGTQIKKPEGTIDPNFPKCAGCIRSSHNAHCAWALFRSHHNGMRKPKCVDGDKFEPKPA